MAPVIGAVRGLLRCQAGPDDDFFDSGGDSLGAMTLVLELEKTLRTPVPAGTVLAGRTPRGIVRRLRDVRSVLSRQIEPLRLRPDDVNTVFVVAGVNGTCEGVRPWIVAWPAGWSVYGVLDRAAVCAEAPADTLDILADQAASAILATGRPDPIHLLGYSFGGLLAYETAVRLQQRGRIVGFLGLIDTPSPPAPVNILAEGVRGREILVEARSRAGRQRPPSLWDQKMTLFRAGDHWPEAAEDYLWSRFAPRVEVVQIAGTHETFGRRENLPALATAFAVSLQDIAGANASSAVQNVILMPLRGFVDYVTPTLIEGWAQDLRAPESPVFLELIVDGAVAAQFYANIARRDLAEAGLGSGRHSFSCKLPAALTAAQCESVYVRRVSDGLFLGRYKPKTN